MQRWCRVRPPEVGMSRSSDLPAPRPLLAPLRELDSAQTRIRRLADRRLLITIRHAPLRGVTPEMLGWWFQNIEGTITVEGQEYLRYLIWHPLDHISFATTRLADGSVGAGVKFKIVEAFGRDPSLLIRTRDHVDLIDETGLRLSARVAAVELFALHHRFTSEPDGAQYDSMLMFGVAGRLGRLVNPVLQRRVFTEHHAQAWLKHNVEEVGMLEHLLPLLYAERGLT
jgi:hypothetical protein